MFTRQQVGDPYIVQTDSLVGDWINKAKGKANEVVAYAKNKLQKTHEDGQSEEHPAPEPVNTPANDPPPEAEDKKKDAAEVTTTAGRQSCRYLV